ncbi:PREDICTED: probable nucleoredoxin 2 [Ipomoea nil]|uniref:probable nucleoredoxin 2 n=1 Tax=Ipomoea nil TaxID=35883 RepID=UPI00090139BB|nr:PREDICTED: probable nucleoredoxin 2 [Ipomoea nil]
MREVKELETNGHGFNFKVEDEEVADGEIIKKMLAAGEAEKEMMVSVGSTFLLSLLATKDRDFLLSPSGTQVKISELRTKVIGIYFSANWYAPCKKFTEVLVSVYKQFSYYNSGFEIVFVSSDEDSEAFAAYRASMPWLAIPFSDLETKKSLNQRFNVEGIPCLVVLQPNNNKDDAIVYDGVELVYRYGVEAFPFTKERLQKLREDEREKHEKQTLKDLLTNSNRDFVLGHSTMGKVPVTSLTGKTIGLYFSAKWCVPGLKFTSKLISVYQKIKQRLPEGEDFEIVYVSSDDGEMEFEGYFEAMPWLALPFGDPNAKNLRKYFDIRGIPSLVILGPDGKTLSKQGRNLVCLYKENAYPFTKARMEALEREMDEEAKWLPKSKHHGGHKHELSLVSEGTGGGAYICCECDEQGHGWAYQCLECGYEVHPNCVRTIDHGQTS